MNGPREAPLAVTPVAPERPDAAFDAWLRTPAGRYMLAWEQAQLDRTVADLFGYHALQLGVPALRGLRANRMPHRWLATEASGDEARDAVDATGSTPTLGGGAANPSVLADPQVDLASNPVRSPTAAFPPWDDEAGERLALRRRVDLRCAFDALPLQSQSIDLVVLPHTLEMARDPHQTLREVDRVLVPEGRVVICGFNQASLWGAKQQCGRVMHRLGGRQPLYLPRAGEFIGYRRLRDWLRLLSLEVEGGRFGCYAPAVRSETWLHRYAWMDKTGDRWWPVFGAVYLLVAVKRVRGIRMVGLARRGSAAPSTAPAAVAPHFEQPSR